MHNILKLPPLPAPVFYVPVNKLTVVCRPYFLLVLKMMDNCQGKCFRLYNKEEPMSLYYDEWKNYF